MGTQFKLFRTSHQTCSTMKLAFANLVGLSFANIQNLQFSGHTADSFTVSWDEIANYTDSFTVSLMGHNTHESLLDEVTSANSHTFSGLDEATIYNVNVAMGTGNNTYGQAGGVGRTEGEGQSLTQTWGNGAMGNILWPVATTCAYSFSISFGCALDMFGVSADMNSQGRVVSTDNTTWNVYVSGKHMQNSPFLSYFIASECDFSALTDADITFTAFDGYASEITALDVNSGNSWATYNDAGEISGRTEQITINIADNFRAHCVPSVLVTIPCDATVINSWQVSGEIDDGFDGSNTVIGYDLDSIWQSGFGMQYTVPVECAEHNATVSLNYVAAPQLSN